MMSDILDRHEGKTLEFKENTNSTLNIVKTVIAFANTAGGILVIGIRDKTKEVVGVEHVLEEEERLTSIIADSIEPLLLPDIEILNYKKKELIILHVPYLVGPYYFKQTGLDKGVYIRFGSTNRLADTETIAYLQRLSKQISFDELPCIGANIKELDSDLILKTLKPLHKTFNKKYYESLGITTTHHNKTHPSYGGILLFSPKRLFWLPDSIIRCVCFAGTTRETIIDQKDIVSNLISAIDEIIAFIRRHTSVAAKIGFVRREDVPQFPPTAVREAVINAIVHADYAMKGSSIQIAVFSNRIEMSNPGGLPFGQTIESALSGISRMRNKFIGKIFRELRLIERLGSGLPRIVESYKDANVKPLFEEINNHFRVTLFETHFPRQAETEWAQQLLKVLAKEKTMSAYRIAQLWKVTDRTARNRLKLMIEQNLVRRNAKSSNDPTTTYSRI
jgi:ATP-dependent DNA helicase RecG